jgi:hypothetical protein
MKVDDNMRKYKLMRNVQLNVLGYTHTQIGTHE